MAYNFSIRAQMQPQLPGEYTVSVFTHLNVANISASGLLLIHCERSPSTVYDKYKVHISRDFVHFHFNCE